MRTGTSASNINCCKKEAMNLTRVGMSIWEGRREERKGRDIVMKTQSQKQTKKKLGLRQNHTRMPKLGSNCQIQAVLLPQPREQLGLQVRRIARSRNILAYSPQLVTKVLIDNTSYFFVMRCTSQQIFLPCDHISVADSDINLGILSNKTFHGETWCLH